MRHATGTVFILFTDLVSSTELLEAIGDEAMDQVRRTHFQLLREAVRASAGEVVKTAGDGVMCIFASGLDAIGCAVGMQEAVQHYNNQPGVHQVQMRVGMHAGEAVREEDDYFGTPVVIAKRLCDLAGPGQILASDLVRALVGNRGHFNFRDTGPMSLKGIALPVPTKEIAWGAALDQPPPSVTYTRVSPDMAAAATATATTPAPPPKRRLPLVLLVGGPAMLLGGIIVIAFAAVGGGSTEKKSSVQPAVVIAATETPVPPTRIPATATPPPPPAQPTEAPQPAAPPPSQPAAVPPVTAPQPTARPSGGSGITTASGNAVCQDGTQILINFSAATTGTLQLTRISVTLDGRSVFSQPISGQNFTNSTTTPASSGSHVVVISAEDSSGQAPATQTLAPACS